MARSSSPTGTEEKAKLPRHFLKRKMIEYEKPEEEIQQLRKEVDLLDITITDLELGLVMGIIIFAHDNDEVSRKSAPA